jgi:mannose-P-dolichol utilization defect protein 1
VDDKLILYSFMAGFALNAIIATQMIYYWNAPSPKAKGKRREAIPMESTAGTSTAVPRKGPSTRRRG